MRWARRRWIYGVVLGCLMLGVVGCGGGSGQDQKSTHTSGGFSPLKMLLSILEIIRPEQPDTVKSLETQAAAFAAQQRYELAEKHYRQALLIREKAWGEQSQHVAPGLDQLATFLIARGQYAEAEAFLQRALAIRERALGARHPDVATNLDSYAAFLRQQHREAEAAPLEERARAIRSLPAP